MSLDNALIQNMEDEYEIQGEKQTICKPALVSKIINPYTNEYDYLFIDDIPMIKTEDSDLYFKSCSNEYAPMSLMNNVKIPYYAKFRFNESDPENLIINIYSDTISESPIFTSTINTQAFVNNYCNSIYKGSKNNISLYYTSTSEIANILFYNNKLLKTDTEYKSVAILSVDKFKMGATSSFKFNQEDYTIDLIECYLPLDIDPSIDYTLTIPVKGYKYLVQLKFDTPKTFSSNINIQGRITSIKIEDDAESVPCLVEGDSEDEIITFKKSLLDEVTFNMEDQQNYEDLFDDLF